MGYFGLPHQEVLVKFSSLLFALCVSATAFAFPHGEYRGTGRLHDQEGHKKNYKVETRITTVGGITFLRTDYHFEDGTHGAFQFRVEAAPDAFFAAHDIEGYCFGEHCHYRKADGGGIVEETLSTSGSRLYKLGSRTEDGRKIAWIEELVKP
jgi:hypothetical protein